MSVGISRYIGESAREPDPLSPPRFQDGESCLVVNVRAGWRLERSRFLDCGGLKTWATVEEWKERMFVPGSGGFVEGLGI